MTFSGNEEDGTSNRCFNIGCDLDNHLDRGIYIGFSCHCSHKQHCRCFCRYVLSELHLLVFENVS